MEGNSGGKEEPYISWGDKHLCVRTLSPQIDRQVSLQISQRDR